MLNSQYSISLELENNKEWTLSFSNFFLNLSSIYLKYGLQLVVFNLVLLLPFFFCLFVFLPLVLVLDLLVSSWEGTDSIAGRGWC